MSKKKTNFQKSPLIEKKTKSCRKNLLLLLKIEKVLTSIYKQVKEQGW